MYKNILSLVMALSVVTAVTFGIYFVQTSHNDKQRFFSEQAQARKDCSSKIPDSDESVQRSGIFTDPSSTSYSKYPAYDRCLASKGF